MSFRNMSFELTPDQIKARDELGKKLLELPEIQLFIEKYDCPEQVIVENASKFKRWVQSKRKAHSYAKNEVVANPELASFVDLAYDKHTGIIDEFVTELPILDEIENEYSYLNKYQVMPLPLNLREAHFDKIDYQNESAHFKSVMGTLVKFVEDNSLGYFIFGDLGIGKSYISAAVTNEFAKKNHSVAFVHVPSLLSLLKQNFNNSYELDRILRKLRSVKVLVLDDLGAEPITSWSRDEILLSILNDRLENKRKTIITSNYRPELLVGLYKLDTRGVSDEIRARRLVDRIHALTSPLEMTGKNRRIAQK